MTGIEQDTESLFFITALDEMVGAGNIIENDRYRYEHFEVIYITEGCCICMVDLEEFELNEHTIGVVRPGQVRKLLLNEGLNGYVISFNKGAFYHTIHNAVLLKIDSCFDAYSGSCRLLGLTVKQELKNIVLNLAREYTGNRMLRFEIIRGLLQVLLMYLGRSSVENNGVVLSKTTVLVQTFFKLLDEKFMTHVSAIHYACEMSVSTSYLNQQVKRVSGYTTSYHIQQRRLMEAKRIAFFSRTSMKEVAVALGFDDMAHFSRFFKKASGQNFKEFKKQLVET